MIVRNAEISDIERVAEIERLSYPAAEGASEAQISERINAFPENFFILENNGEVLAFINGIRTDSSELTDEMYENTSLNQRNGSRFMVFSVVTNPLYRRKGYASRVMEELISECRNRDISEIVLTCKEKLIPFYSRFGFIYEHVSGSVHGGAVWHQMRLKLAE